MATFAPVPTAFIPSDDRIEQGSSIVEPDVYQPPNDLSSFNPEEIASSIVAKLNKALESRDFESLSSLLFDSSYWRDHLCISWDLRTLKGQKDIVDFLKAGSSITKLELDTSQTHRAPNIAPIDVYAKIQAVTFFTKVTTTVGAGQGVIRAIPYDGDWKIYTCFTSLKQITGHEEPRETRRPLGTEHGDTPDSQNWAERRASEKNFSQRDPAVLIIGAGQGGLAVAARLKMLKVDALVIDREERVGDNWRKRYRHLVLHDPIWFDHLPYLNFPDHWPVFTPKDKLGDFFEAYVNMLELNVWTKTELVSSEWDDAKNQWTVTVERQVGDRKETRTFHPRHIIQATGHSGEKNFPQIKGASSFKGRLCHSSEFPGADSGSKGKKAIIIGSCNSGHDIAQDYYENGYDVTMVQRSSTCVVSSSSIVDIALKGLYDETSPPVEDADMILWSRPGPLLKSLQVEVAGLQYENDKETLTGLEKAGFKLDYGPSHCGLLMKYFQRGGGYYIDVGASQLIIDGKIKIKQGQEVAEILADGVKFADDTVLPADEIVFATGYQNMRTQARLIFGDKVASRVNDVWGWDAEGEFRTMWRRSGHPGFWLMGGNLALTRYFSLLLALQIKALEEGLTA